MRVTTERGELLGLHLSRGAPAPSAFWWEDPDSYALGAKLDRSQWIIDCALEPPLLLGAHQTASYWRDKHKWKGEGHPLLVPLVAVDPERFCCALLHADDTCSHLEPLGLFDRGDARLFEWPCGGVLPSANLAGNAPPWPFNLWRRLFHVDDSSVRLVLSQILVDSSAPAPPTAGAEGHRCDGPGRMRACPPARS